MYHHVNQIFLFFFIINIGFGGYIMAIDVNQNGSCRIDGIVYPAVGFGTYPLQDKTCLKAVEEAAKLGYRIIDTATLYNNFAPTGQAIKEFGREKFYIISKVWPNSQTSKLLLEDIKRTLKELQISYLDAYLIHWPNSKVPIEETLSTMEQLRIQGFIHHIGLSNVNVNHVKRALELNIPITWVQVEMNPLFYDAELIDFCHKNGIGVQAWAPLSRGKIGNDPFLISLGQKYEKTVAQIAIRWILQHHCVPLPGSKNKQHIQENFDVLDFSLSDNDMNEINKRAKLGQRERVKEEYGLGFTDEFDFSYEECWPK